jgi:hypothetical protein
MRRQIDLWSLSLLNPPLAVAGPFSNINSGAILVKIRNFCVKYVLVFEPYPKHGTVSAIFAFKLYAHEVRNLVSDPALMLLLINCLWTTITPAFRAGFSAAAKRPSMEC